MVGKGLTRDVTEWPRPLSSAAQAVCNEGPVFFFITYLLHNSVWSYYAWPVYSSPFMQLTTKFSNTQIGLDSV